MISCIFCECKSNPDTAKRCKRCNRVLPTVLVPVEKVVEKIILKEIVKNIPQGDITDPKYVETVYNEKNMPKIEDIQRAFELTAIKITPNLKQALTILGYPNTTGYHRLRNRLAKEAERNKNKITYLEGFNFTNSTD